MNLSACGLICSDCPFFNKECKGCYYVCGKPFWTAHATANGICPLYDCSVHKKALPNCGACVELPCKLFNELKDPNISEEEHQKSILQRVVNLRKNNK